jgi:integrase/recombinase XerD
MSDSGLVQTIRFKQNGNNELQKWINAFIVDRKTMQLSRHTIKFYQVEFRRFMAYCNSVGITEVETITPDLLRAYLLHLEDTGRNPGGINASYRAIKTFLIWYENEAEPIAWRNPIKKIRMPKIVQMPIKPVEIADVEKLLNTCHAGTFLDLRDKAILLFLLDTGLRAFELCALDIDHVDLIAGDVQVERGKGAKPRLCMIGKRTRKAIRQYKRERLDDSPALWVTDDGSRLTYWGLNQMIRRRANKAGIKKPGLHDFRRAFALNCLRGGMDIFSLQKLMGHSDLTVLRRYLAQDDDDLRNAHSKASPVDSWL